MALDPTATAAPAGYLRLGRLGRTFQLEGALRLLFDEAVSYGDDESVAVRAMTHAKQLFVTGLGQTRVRDLDLSKGGAPLLKLEGVRERNAAQQLVNATIWVNPALLPDELAAELAEEIEAGTDAERLVGLEVRMNGARVGEVSAAFLDTPNALIEAALEGGAKALLPLSAPYVELTDEAVELTDPPAGLIDVG